MLNKQEYAKGTFTTTRGPWAVFVSAHAVCEDGRLRKVKLSPCADSLWTVPARLTYRGTTVSGFITFASDDGLSTNPEQWVKFIAQGKHASIFCWSPEVVLAPLV